MINTHRFRSIAALGLIAFLSAFYCLWVEDGYEHQYQEGFPVRQLETIEEGIAVSDGDVTAKPADGAHVPKLTVCGRRAEGDESEFIQSLEDGRYSCPEMDKGKPMFIIDGHHTYGQTSNHLRALFHAMQYVRDNDAQLAITHDSWAMDVVTSMFEVGRGKVTEVDHLQERVESALCVKVFAALPKKWEDGWNIIHLNTVEHFSSEPKYQKYLSKYLFNYDAPKIGESRNGRSKGEDMRLLLYTLRTLYKNLNTNDNKKPQHWHQSGDMCTGVDMLFGREFRGMANYTVVHHRHMDGNTDISDMVCSNNRCHPRIALDMTPDFIKAILGPIGMLEHPIVMLTDGQNPEGMQRLMDDPVLGPQIRLVPEKACWFGGDVTLAVTANAFIGNPASTMTNFMAQSRVALGRTKHNYIQMNLNTTTGEWYDTDGGEMYMFKVGNMTLERFGEESQPGGRMALEYFD